MKILLIGGGSMGEAFASSIIKSGDKDVYVAEPNKDRKEYLNTKLNVKISGAELSLIHI